ncbi:hypothetical protein EMIT0P201_11524 [Pseudomonas chlororaphis]
MGNRHFAEVFAFGQKRTSESCKQMCSLYRSWQVFSREEKLSKDSLLPVLDSRFVSNGVGAP